MSRFGVRVATLGLGLGLSLTACTSGSTSDSAAATTSGSGNVCAAADDLRTSMAALGDVKVVQQGTVAVKQAWSTVQKNWTHFADVAHDKYGSKVDGVQADADRVQSAVTSAGDDASAETLGAVGATVGAFLHNAGALVDEVRTAC